MRNRSINRRNPREEDNHRWEWQQTNPDPAPQSVENEGRRNEGQSGQAPSPERSPGAFGFLGWEELPPQNPEGQQNTRNSPERGGEGYRDRRDNWRYENPDAWLDEPLPWELPPEGEQRRRIPPSEQNSRAETSPYRRSEPQQSLQPRQEPEGNDHREAGKSTQDRGQDRGWEDFPSLYDELETVESPRARVKGPRPRGWRSRRRRKNR